MNATPEHRPSTSAFIVAFASIYLIWGSTYLGIRVAVETIPPFLMGTGRFLIAGCLLMILVRSRGAPKPTRRQWLDNAFIGAFLLLGGNGFVSWAEQSLPSGLTALIIGIQPALMVLTEWAWPGGKRPTTLTFVGLFLGFAGVAWLAAPWESSATSGVHLPAVLLVLLACGSWAFGSIWSRHVKNPASPFLASSLQMVGGSVALFIGAVIHGELETFKVSTISGQSIAAFFYLTFVGSLVGFSTFVWLMKHTTPARVSTYAYVNPVVAVFLGWLILHEPVTTRMLLAAATIVAAVVIITTQKSRKPAITPTEAPATVTPREPAIETERS
jgi:drug/metabolite transporter (DMT)-like permease